MRGLAPEINLPEETYQTSDINGVIEELCRRLDGQGAMYGFWEGNVETALYFYGKDAKQMTAIISDYLVSHPLGQGARVVTHAP